MTGLLTRCQRQLVLLLILLLPGLSVSAAPFIAPGDAVLRSDLQRLADAGVLSETVLVWPVSWNDVRAGIDAASSQTLDPLTAASLARVRERAAYNAVTGGPYTRVRAGATGDPLLIRSFESTLREKGELEFGVSWMGQRLASEIVVTRVFDAAQDNYRLDGSYLSMAVGNWALVAGKPERWWGPGWQGSLLLSTNARPMPQLGLQRIASKPAERRFLRWMGPWSLTTFMGHLDDERYVKNGLLFGVRVTAKPMPRLEVGISRTAQWCGDNRPCSLSAFTDLLQGHDNRGINVDPAKEPGNQLGGFDLRWSFKNRPVATYMQWIAEDSRPHGIRLGSWLRQVGAEYWGALPWEGWQHHTYFEAADTVCATGGVGFGDSRFQCGYENSVFRSGYRYQGRSIGHGIDNDSRSFAVGTLLIGPGGKSWGAALHHARINEGPVTTDPNGVSQLPADYTGLIVSYARPLPVGELTVRLHFEELDPAPAAPKTTNSGITLEWRFGF